jgi:hypothetical protein
MYQLAARTKPGYDPTLYSIEWATVVTNHLKKQLSEIALPTTAKGFNIKITFKSVLAETDTRERWVNRFTYLSASHCCLICFYLTESKSRSSPIVLR